MQTLVAYVENKPGVLNRVASLARRLAINIDSLTVGPTENEEIARMTIVAHTDEKGAHRLEASLEKLVDVRLAENISERSLLERDLDGTHQSIPRARYRRRAGIAHPRSFRHGGQNRWPARSTSSFRRSGNGSHRPHRHDSRQRFAAAAGSAPKNRARPTGNSITVGPSRQL